MNLVFFFVLIFSSLPSDMTRLFILLLLSASLSLFSNAQAQAQDMGLDEPRPTLTVANWIVTTGVFNVSAPSASLLSAGIRGSVPLRTLLPQTSPDSRITFAQFSGGARLMTDEKLFSYHALGLKLVLQRAWWSGAFTLLDLSSHTLFKYDRTWFELATGPGIHRSGSSGAISGAIQVLTGRRSTALFAPQVTEDTGAGWHAGLRTQVSTRLQERVSISGFYSLTRFTSGELSLDEAGINLRAVLSNDLDLSFLLREVLNASPETGGSNKNPGQIGFQLGYTIN